MSTIYFAVLLTILRKRTYLSTTSSLRLITREETISTVMVGVPLCRPIYSLTVGKERNLQKRYNPNVLEGCRSTWEVLEERSTISSCDTIAQALRKAGELASNACGAEVLVLGSLHLVSGVLSILDSSE